MKMKKTMILALAVLGMVLGSFAVVTPAQACNFVGEDPYGCDIWDCVDCLFWECSTGQGKFCYSDV
jgi:hypothetical protein